MSDLRQCQCEHIAHFEKDWLTPNGNPGHRADTYFHVEATKQVKTPYGTFRVCVDCRRDCLHAFQEVAA